MNEFELISRIFKQYANKLASDKDNNDEHNNSSVICGIGDDAAVLMPPKDNQLVSCTDTLIAGRHFPHDTSAYAIGYKSVAVNLSDLAAMGATPHSILLALSLPITYKEKPDWLTSFAQGLFDCCQQFGVQLIGGDTTQSEQLTISVTALGFATQCIYRDGAQVDDYIVVTGTIGDASLALQHILNNQTSSLQYRLDTPVPCVEIGRWLNAQSIATSMIDISDGLLQDLGHICTHSGVYARLDLEKIPTHVLLEQLPLVEKVQHQLTGGDDYQLLFTCSQAKLSELEKSDFAFTVIGEITHNIVQPVVLDHQDIKQPVSLFYKNKPYPYNGQGYQHF